MNGNMSTTRFAASIILSGARRLCAEPARKLQTEVENAGYQAPANRSGWNGLDSEEMEWNGMEWNGMEEWMEGT